jgi:malate dehydrogenase (quinone)
MLKQILVWVIMAINKIKTMLLFSTLWFFISACHKPIESASKVDVVVIGGGIMSATLSALLHELDANLSIELFEKLDEVALESSAAWNNAGTGHASYAELNYTPQAADGTIDSSKAIQISEAFEQSLQFWAHQVRHERLPSPKTFINNVPHMSFVWGDDNISYLKKRYQALVAHPLFFGMEYSEDRDTVTRWAPLIMEGRDKAQKIAATRMNLGVDVDFGALTRGLIDDLAKSNHFKLHVAHDVIDIKRNQDQTWTVVVKDLKNNTQKATTARFVFIGAGGGSLKLLQQSGIPEAKGFGGFPVGGAWLVSEKKELADKHHAKVYGKASVGSPPMSVPHLDTRFIDGKKALLFGPFATYSTKFLKQGSWLDWPLSISFGNAIPMLTAGVKNLDLVGYLIGQVLMSKEKRLALLQEYFPEARLEDWREELAGQRVQVIKEDPDKGGILQFGTELVSSHDGSLVALLGASPGASIAVKVMLDVLNISFAEQLKTPAWQERLKNMIPSYGQKLSDNPLLLWDIRKQNREALQLD